MGCERAKGPCAKYIWQPTRARRRDGQGASVVGRFRRYLAVDGFLLGAGDCSDVRNPKLPELCPQCRKPALEDADDPVANLGRREGGSVYETTPAIDLILGADDHLCR